ncbi:hypothetical protein DPMN_133184 [Dreissena polymorpha]|uniref:Uncharacterized protein n=1 Tax=Dreissena polymorpha TaxID=45954 RepID=A0A9D4JEJ1_DREPO|nr:hypothetical protein DPMN_133184 [Dreissena polymorpha]
MMICDCQAHTFQILVPANGIASGAGAVGLSTAFCIQDALPGRKPLRRRHLPADDETHVTLTLSREAENGRRKTTTGEAWSGVITPKKGVGLGLGLVLQQPRAEKYAQSGIVIRIHHSPNVIVVSVAGVVIVHESRSGKAGLNAWTTQTDRPADRQTGRQTDRQTDRQTCERQTTERQTGRQPDRQTVRQIDKHTVRQTGRQA